MKILIDQAYWNKSMKRTQINQINYEIKDRKNTTHSKPKKEQLTEDITAAVAAAVEDGRL
jgi:hypothetical protein